MEILRQQHRIRKYVKQQTVKEGKLLFLGQLPLYALGSIIKRSIRIDDTLIPGILCLVGVLLSALVSVAACEPVGWMQWVILAAVSVGQGYVLAAAAICLNQLIKQHSRAGALKKGFDGKEEEDETGN